MSTAAATAPPVTGNGNGNTALAKPAAQKPELIVHDSGPVAHLMDTARFNQAYRIATMMAKGSLCPKHLKGQTDDKTAANCFRVVNQALRWGFDPFAVADETYEVHGRLGYQGKLIAAVINTRANLQGRLRLTYKGSGDQREITLHGRFKDETDDRTVSMTVAQGRTDNAMWTNDPDQKLFYSGAIKWARRHCPEIILGVLTDDDLDRIRLEVEPEPKLIETSESKTSQLSNRLAERQEAVTQTDSTTEQQPPSTEPSFKTETSAEQTREPGDDPPEHEDVRLSDLALEIEAVLTDDKVTQATNLAQKQRIIKALAEEKLVAPEATHLQNIVARNAERFKKTAGQKPKETGGYPA